MRLPLFATLLVSLLAPRAARAEGGPIDFNYEIRPILSAKCFHCHGPDEAARKAKLRLDLRPEALKEREGVRPIVPGDLAASELVSRITSEDREEVMPPPKEGQPLTEAEIDVLKRWIAQGAEYKEHWAWIAPVRPAVPQVAGAVHPVDAFIRQRLLAAGLQPSPEADRPTLLRRLSLDLIGLPPTPAETAAFVGDTSADWYERAVDRLLASPHFGEKWARMWLDLARYADSTGYGSDFLRLNIWPYRDWVIGAFNRDLPYDQFTVEQLAGDLLPHPTQEQLLATAFHRNTMTNVEGGTVREEYRVAAVKDRISTTAEVWMGLTLQCAQCHSHKFDPISQTDYYRFYAIFNQTEDNDRQDEAPTLPMPTAEEKARQEALRAEIAALQAKLEANLPELESEEHAWEAQMLQPVTWTALAASDFHSGNGSQFAPQPDGSVLATGGSGGTDRYVFTARSTLPRVTAFRLEALPDDSLPNHGPGRSASGNAVLSHLEIAEVRQERPAPPAIRYVRVEAPGKDRLLSLAEVQAFHGAENLAPSGKASQSSTDFDSPAERAIDGNTDGDYNRAHSITHTAKGDDPWWELDLGSEQPVERLVLWNRTDSQLGIRLVPAKVLALDEARHPVAEFPIASAPSPSAEFDLMKEIRVLPLRDASADFSQAGFEVENALDNHGDAKKGWAFAPHNGQPHAAVFEIEGSADATVFRVTLVQGYGDTHLLGRFRLSATDTPQLVRELPPAVRQILALEPSERAEEQRHTLDAYYRNVSPLLAEVRRQRSAKEAELNAIKPVSVPVVRELAAGHLRESHLLNKGNYLTPGDKLEPALLASFVAGQAPVEKPDRLAVANWLISPANPLVARVAVNRFWAQLFGAGLVETEEDFGTQGALPTHPELLDWLAVTFRSPAGSDPAQPGLGWDMKALLKLLVTSATYRQSSRTLPEHLEKDPRNRLLAHYPRRRLEAEVVRDQALALSGLLSSKMGGPSVYPPQPEGLWHVAFNGGQNGYKTSTGEDRYRRALYTIWRRTMPYPSMTTFDAPSRESCTLRRIPTNTPLQAFVTLNDPCFVECAQALARRILHEGGTDRIGWALQLVLGRPAPPEEVAVLQGLLDRELETYRADAKSAAQLAAGETQPLPPDSDPAELAAWTVLANVLLNLDAVLTKG